MFMSQHQYAYAAAPAAPPRQFSTHGTSSAFSSSANPDEDWTKISDLAERRRIQNRIAQRNYRKKLKRRLEDLERRAGPSDGDSPSASDKSAAGSRSSKKASPAKKAAQQPTPPPTQPIAKLSQAQFTPPMHPDDELLFQPAYDGRERTQSPPLFTYSTYPDEATMMGAPYQQYRPLTTEAYPDWSITAAVPVSLPPMTHFSEALKREQYPTEDAMSSYMGYGFMDMSATPYDPHSNPNTPPLSHSFDHSAACSDAGYEYPTTPLSMPGSPNLMGTQ